MAGHRRRHRPDAALQSSARAANRMAHFDARSAAAPDPVARLQAAAGQLCSALRRLPESEGAREAERMTAELLQAAERLERKEAS